MILWWIWYENVFHKVSKYENSVMEIFAKRFDNYFERGECKIKFWIIFIVMKQPFINHGNGCKNFWKS